MKGQPLVALWAIIGLNFITMEKGITYVSPEIEVMEVEIEQGFAQSLTNENEGISGEGEPIYW